jgi:hypothetical protein
MANEIGFTERFKRNLLLAMDQGAEIAAQKAADFAPRGATNQLKHGIETNKAKLQGDKITGFVTSDAVSESGFHYAWFQHDELLRHFQKPSVTRGLPVGFAEVGQGSSIKKRYQSGYRKRKARAPKFRTQYLERGLDAAQDDIIELLTKAIIKT